MGSGWVKNQLFEAPSRRDQHHGMARDGLAPADRPNVLAGLGLDVDRGGGELEQPGEAGPDGRLVRPELGFLGMNDHVAVHRVPPLPKQQLDDFGQQPGTVQPLPPGIGVRIVLSNISQAGGPEQGIGHGMADDIRVGMACQSRADGRSAVRPG